MIQTKALGLTRKSFWGMAGIGLLLMLAAFAGWMVSTAWSQSHDHKIVMPGDLEWQDVAALPKGAKAAVIEGPMDQAVPFTVRLRFPADYKIPAHWHPVVERVTILAGGLNLGFGDKFDKTKGTALTPGSMSIMQPKTNHFAWTDTETIVQLNGTGPWDVIYVNPDDDPRKK